MRTLSRIGIVSLFAIGAFLVAGAAAGDAYGTGTLKPAVDLPDKVAAGQRIDIDVNCDTGDKKAHLHVTGAHVSVGTDVSLKKGKASLSYRVTPLAPAGEYDIKLTCEPSDLKASTTITVIG